MTTEKSPIAGRFRGFLPVVIDVETGGLNPQTDALLELAACPIEMADDGQLRPGPLVSTHVEAFEGANIDPKSLEITGIIPDHPLRLALPERDALTKVLQPVRLAVRNSGCQRAILVGHNPAMDLAFVNAAAARSKYKRNPLHPFSTFDTATLGGLAFGQTVLARACQAAGLEWDQQQAHSAIYDTEMTAALFCRIVNLWQNNIGLPAVNRRQADAIE